MKERTWTVDRFEADVAVCETDQRKMEQIPRGLLPKEVKEGDILIQRNGTFFIDQEQTRRRTEEMAKKIQDMWE